MTLKIWEKLLRVKFWQIVTDKANVAGKVFENLMSSDLKRIIRIVLTGKICGLFTKNLPPIFTAYSR